VGSSTTTYVVNALGQRIKKSGGSAGTVLYMYDEAGHTLGEYTSTGALTEETIWLGDTPVATIVPSGSTVAVYYLITDHLNTPKKISQPSSNKLAWRWDSDPFGIFTPNQNPQSLGTFVYNLRYPGQMYDSEAGLNYNYFRDYDPQVGRYVESDPIGFKGGSLSTYAYAGSNPASSIDPSGLAKICCRLLDSIFGSGLGQRHCYVIADDGTRFGLYPENGKGVPRTNDPRDTGGACSDCKGKGCDGSNQNQCLSNAASTYPVGIYGLLGPNSNSYAGYLARSCCSGGVPPGVKNAPGINDAPPSLNWPFNLPIK
jgi:RHS repeat-associated protein